MINIIDAEILVKALGAEYCYETLHSGGFKFTLLLNKETNEVFCITIAEFSDKPEWDCVYSLFKDRKLLLSGGGVFNDVINGLKEYLLVG
jgi:hypothetical protein